MRFDCGRLSCLLILISVLAPVTLAQRASSSTPAAADANPTAILARAKEVMRFARANHSLVHYRAVAASEQNYQSDRTYPPFFSAMEVKEAWLDPRSGVERVSTQTTFPGGGPPPQVSFTDQAHAYALVKEQMRLLPRPSMQSRYLNPWNVIADWVAAGDARFAGKGEYRDYPRIVLARLTSDGEQRLFVDPKTGFPLKLDLDEKHYLWGQRHIEYVYTNWTLSGDVMLPGSSFRLADGKTEISQTFGDVEIIAPDTAPSLSLPEGPAPPADTLPRFLQPLDLKVVQVGPKTYLLSNPGYTEAVTRIGNEVFLFDATQGEERGRKDAEAIARLFPGKLKVTVVVTDLAWPHIAGLRYWVASGATIIAHKAAREFLQSVIARRWTLAPDLLEQRRKTTHLKFVGVDGPYSLAGGAISLHPIDGIGSEVALIGYLVSDRFLWASDYIQTVSQPTSYASEVWRAVKRDGLTPERTAAEHLPLTPWSKIEELQK
ncbi:MAG TPA: hypothetical protein VLB68_12660 [Pyrinomonadaceae bacterium]|nr:hypothetical protein [Pyrinomonadaceae bacterium]